MKRVFLAVVTLPLEILEALAKLAALLILTVVFAAVACLTILGPLWLLTGGWPEPLPVFCLGIGAAAAGKIVDGVGLDVTTRRGRPLDPTQKGA